MSIEDVQAIVDTTVGTAMKTKHSWYIAIILSVLLGSGASIFAIGIWEGKDESFKEEMREWKKSLQSMVDIHEREINTLVEERNQRLAYHNAMVQPKIFEK